MTLPKNPNGISPNKILCSLGSHTISAKEERPFPSKVGFYSPIPSTFSKSFL